jgi:hypothetical protein
MKDIVLRETSFHIGECRFPKDCEVDRLQIKFNIFESYILKKYTNKQHKDYNVKWCLGIENIQTYIKEHWQIKIKDGRAQAKGALDKHSEFGTLLFPNEMSKVRNHIIYPKVHESPQYTFVYGVDVKDCFLTINYFNQHNNYSGITLPLKNNHFIMFNSDLNYCFEKNKTEDVNTIHTTLYRLL